jgi:1-hydroxycarotenoid 3,4-desaturase
MTARRVIVIGAGAGGLAAACDLARQGVEVTLIERAPVTGGKIHQQRVGPALIDSGPTVLTMRWVFDSLLADCGERFEDGLLRLRPLSVIARHAWSADEQLDLFADAHASSDAIGRFAGASEAARFLGFCDEARRLYHALEHAYIRAERPSLASMTTDLGARGLALLGGLGPFASLWRSLGRHFQDPRLRQLFARYATYCGGSPWEAPATLALIAYVEMRGVWAAEGGMQAVAARLERAARKLGVVLRLGLGVRQIEVNAGRASGVTLDDGTALAADALIFNGDAQALAGGLLGAAARGAVRSNGIQPRSLSALTWAIHGTAEGFPLSYHNVFFQPDYQSEFDDVFGHARLPRKPTLYLCAQARANGHHVAAGQPEPLFCLINAPARGDQSALAEEEIEQCTTTAFNHLQRCGLTIHAPTTARLCTTPQQFHQRFPASGGALYGMAPHGWMSSFRRPSAVTPIPGLFLAGGSAHPGAGVPMATLSGRLAAATLMAHLDSTRRSARVRISGGMSTA